MLAWQKSKRVQFVVLAGIAMSIREQISRQRVKHIVSSYRLEGQEVSQFETCLDALLHSYPLPLIELALVETLVDGWASVPLVRGLAFLKQAHCKLKAWETQPIASTLTPTQFQQITGLDPSPIFGSSTPPQAIGQPF